MVLNLTLSPIQTSSIESIQYSSNTAWLQEVDLFRLRITQKIDISTPDCTFV